MSLLNIENLTHGFGTKQLYKGVSFRVNRGEHIGIVGQNGTGKSTLLRILTGEIIPDGGKIVWQRGARIGYLDQHAVIDGSLTVKEYMATAFERLSELEDRMLAYYENQELERAAAIQDELVASDFYSIEHSIERVIGGIGLDGDLALAQLSGGQRAKAFLGKLLLDAPDVLLLDEPTNFLDIDHIEWLEGYLSEMDSAFLIVSHNFDFLDRVTSAILDIEFGSIKKYYGRYSEFVKQKTHIREDYIRRYNAEQREIQRTEAYIRKNIAGVNTRNAQGRRKQLQRMERLAKPQFVEKPNFKIKYDRFYGSTALEVNELSVGYDRALIPPLSFSVANGEKVIIVGFNGIGKSTFLKTLIGEVDPLGGSFLFDPYIQIAYYEQDLRWPDPNATPIETVRDIYPRMTTMDVRRALAQCGVKAEHVDLPVKSLSGGEQSKVKLCTVTQNPSNFLILDEPTNHLDNETKDYLRDVICDYPGSILLVSHEERFYQGIADRIIEINLAHRGEI